MVNDDHNGDLEGSWQRLWHDLGARGDPRDPMDDLLSRWQEPQRHYHTVQHLRECLVTFAGVAAQARHAAEVEAALWFHDAVYNLRESGNEEKSAALAQRVLGTAGVDPQAVERIARMVLATKHDVTPSSPDEQLCVDVDLAILGAPRERFDAYDRQVQAEYSFVPRPLFRRKRREILASLASRPRLYATGHFHAALDASARANLAHAIEVYAG